VIREATEADVPRMVEMGLRFQRNSRYAALLAENPAQMEALARQTVTGAHSTALLAVQDDDTVVGMICLLAYPHHISGEWTGSELAFWVEPQARRAGLALLAAAETWAAQRGCRVLEVVSPDERVDRLYTHLGYMPSERTFRKTLTRTPRPRTTLDPNIVVIDDVLDDPHGYRQAALAGRFGDVPIGADLFRGIQLAPPTVTEWLQARTPTVQVSVSFFRQSPDGQADPHYVHSDAMMGQWTGILYLTPDPPAGDGTAFYEHLDGSRQASLADLPRYVADLDDDRCWGRWWTVAARFNRLLLFPATYFHARALRDNYGTGDDARLIQVLFGGYDDGDRDRSGDCAGRGRGEFSGERRGAVAGGAESR
jgi:GNAT superfamily N-acetyltransferase